MPPTEPAATAWLLAIAAVLIAASALSSRASARSGIPVFLIFIGVGMLAGSEGLGGIEFADYHLSFRLGTVALALILFDGGLNTRLSAMRPAMAPATVLATVGVVGTALVVALGGRLPASRGRGRCCWERSSRPPTPQPSSRSCGGATSSSAAGWGRLSSSSRVSTIPSP